MSALQSSPHFLTDLKIPSCLSYFGPHRALGNCRIHVTGTGHLLITWGSVSSCQQSSSQSRKHPWPPQKPTPSSTEKMHKPKAPLICASLHLLRLIYELQQSNVPSWLRQQQISEPSLLGCKLPCTSSTYFLYSCPSTVSGPGIRTQPLQSTGYLLLKCTSWGMELSTYSQSL